jgi:hypothetical protein
MKEFLIKQSLLVGIEKPCEVCGEIMLCNSINKKFCFKCKTQKRNERYFKRYRKLSEKPKENFKYVGFK